MIRVLGLLAALAATPVLAEDAKPLCAAPPAPVAAYLKAHPALKVVDVPDLRPDDQAFWLKDHAGQCPGMLAFDADGSGRAAYGLLLTEKTGKRLEHLIVLHAATQSYAAHIVHPAEDVYMGVLLRAKPGKYEEPPLEDKPKSITLKHEGLEHVHMEASSTIIYFDKGTFKELFTSD